MRFWRSARVQPDEGNSCGWTQTLPPPTSARRLTGDEEADCVVVGAGLTGLAIARRLAELRPAWRIVIVEARRVGAGASGRASGFVVDLTDAAARMKPQVRKRYVSLAGFGIDVLRRLVREHGIDCGWDERGWIRACAGPAGTRFLDGLPALFREHGIAYEPLDREAMTAVTGSRFYRQGIRLPGYPLVQAGALVRGLAGVLPESVALYEHSPVTRIEGDGRFHLRAGDGSLAANKLFLATNGYTPNLGFYRQRIFPLYTFGSLTRKLTPAEQEALGGESQWGILAMDPMGSTVRRTADQRILIRNHVLYAKNLRVGDQTLREVQARFHRRALLARFPTLEPVEFEYTWSGLMGTARNSLMSIGEPKPSLYVAAAYTAAGIGMSHAAGRLLAEYALGRDSEKLRDLLALPRPTWMPPEPFRSIGGGWLARRMNRKAGDFL
jgi:glycine/D-amino acid oxidase-like deaminating enzyme